jgi:hypothetical protein
MQGADAIDRAGTLRPAIVQRDGQLMLQRGLHQELTLADRSGNLRVRVTAFHDSVAHPVVNGGGVISETDWKSGDVLYDSSTGSLKVMGQNFNSTGAIAELREMLPDDMWVSIGMGTGNALVMDTHPIPVTLEDGLLGLRPRRSEMFAAGFGGKLAHAGTQWQATYRWQPAGTVTPIDTFDANRNNPYLSFYLRQPIRCKGILPNGMEALIDVSNLLAQGYRPFVTSDGSVLYFAQASRAVEGGLSFSF